MTCLGNPASREHIVALGREPERPPTPAIAQSMRSIARNAVDPTQTRRPTKSEDIMSNYTWKRIGSFQDQVHADQWCDRQGISRSDGELRPSGDGVELFVRESADEGKEDRPGGRGFF